MLFIWSSIYVFISYLFSHLIIIQLNVNEKQFLMVLGPTASGRLLRQRASAVHLGPSWARTFRSSAPALAKVSVPIAELHELSTKMT